MSYILVDVETDGPCPGLYSMISLGAVVVRGDLSETFYAEFGPISSQYVDEALAVSGHTREQTCEFPPAEIGMLAFDAWVVKNSNGRPRFISDNNGFDWQWVNYYFWKFLGRNPFGHSSTNLGSLYKGLVRSDFKNFKHLRQTKHTHHPVDDAKGNAEALLAMKAMGLDIRLD